MIKYRMKSVWRSRATAILATLILLITLFAGFPGWLERIAYALLALAIILLGLAGNRPEDHYVEPSTTDQPRV
jgi:hypothetical protein